MWIVTVSGSERHLVNSYSGERQREGTEKAINWRQRYTNPNKQQITETIAKTRTLTARRPFGTHLFSDWKGQLVLCNWFEGKQHDQGSHRKDQTSYGIFEEACGTAWDLLSILRGFLECAELIMECLGKRTKVVAGIKVDWGGAGMENWREGGTKTGQVLSKQATGQYCLCGQVLYLASPLNPISSYFLRRHAL